MKVGRCLASLLVLASVARADVTWETDALRATLDDKGQVLHLLDKVQQRDYAAQGQASPLVMIDCGSGLVPPQAASWNAQDRRLTLQYPGAEVTVAIAAHATHITCEIVGVQPDRAVRSLQWGPMATSIGETVGEVVGVVRDGTFAIGLQGLNAKTLGGLADNPEGRDVSRGRSALPTRWGSTLQAYTMDRSFPRHVDVWGGHFARMPVPPIPGETVVGSRVALFGVAASRALARVGEIEVAEGLPHPIYQGVWSRLNPQLGRSYLIAGYSESTIDEMIGYAKRGNFLSLYHPGPFESWGHYTLNTREFPRGEAGMRQCVEKAAAAGLLLGVHTLTNFINTNDPYVTPVPDRRLAKTGMSTLVQAIGAEDTAIEVAAPEYFNNTKANWLQTVMIGDELIRYGRVSDAAPWTLLDCRRGAFGTHAGAHAQGTEVAKLMDHPYKVFLTSYEMQHEVAQRLAELFNRTGLNHLDFDGHEGCHSSGQGDFATGMFAKVFYDHVGHFVHNGTSNSQPFYWHINTCCNWGEPWYGGFRSSMAEYRINNQAMLERNFMPKMLGWFQLRPETTLSDIEWLLARSAGYNSGFAMATSQAALQANPITDRLLDTIRLWEDLRMKGAFTDEQRQAMRDTTREFHLAQTAHGYLLQPYLKSSVYQHAYYERQPGEPTYVEWQYTQPADEQALQFLLELKGDQGQISNIDLEFDNYIACRVAVVVEAGQTLVCDGTATLRVYDRQGRQVAQHVMAAEPPRLPRGPHAVRFSCDFENAATSRVNVQFTALGAGEPVMD